MRIPLNIVTARRISQIFFVLLTLWLCAVATLGATFWRLSGWQVNFILQLDPLTALGTLLATRTWYAQLLWAIPVIALTAFLGRVFCGFACPLGALNQAVGWLARRVTAKIPGARAAALRARLADNRHSPWQAAKYYVLAFLLASACFGSLQTGLLDPLPLLFRSLNMTVAPVVDAGFQALFLKPRHYASAWLLFTVFAAILGLNFLRPRFFCRYVCPLGALFGLLNRFAPWRMGKRDDAAHGECGNCTLCDTYCEGACSPSGALVASECLMCMNCLDACPKERMTFAGRASAGGEEHLPEPTRRGFLFAALTGALSAPLWTIGGLAETGKNPLLIRPPGSLDEARFLSRCLRCGQCMRVCPTNVIQPALTEAGLEGLWTPVLNYRLGTSGCQVQCVACGNVCPTAAIRPLTLDEKLGQGKFAAKGPVRLGTAFFDRSRCLPWAFERPCLVCQELCPVSPKAIYTRTIFEPIRFGQADFVAAQGSRLSLAGLPRPTVNLGSGDYYLRPAGLSAMASPEAGLRRINAAIWAEQGQTLTLDAAPDAKQGWKLSPGSVVEVVVRLQKPYVDAARCIGCGVCEHECPIAGLRGVRVSFENESRSGPGRMLI
ncbi:MAG: 4Fe-4S dicluster domain-containing protein [Proteobacteria bacterium]|nr:4Fe-4S dicluster domain-containing protein [Pseudomonadota bacterium]